MPKQDEHRPVLVLLFLLGPATRGVGRLLTLFAVLTNSLFIRERQFEIARMNTPLVADSTSAS